MSTTETIPTPSETQAMFLEIATIFQEADEDIGVKPATDRLDNIIRRAQNLQEDAAEAEEMATRLKKIIRRDYEQLIDDIEKEEKAKKCETR